MNKLSLAMAGCGAAAIIVAITNPLPAVASASKAISVALADRSVDATLNGMKIQASAASVKAGEVVFQVANRSSALVHEMLVVRLDKPGQVLPYDTKEDKIDEDKIKSMGEVSELEPGKDGMLTVKLAPGVYALLCNQPGHYHAGMVTNLTVIR